MNNTVLKWVGSKVKVMAELKKHLPAGDRLVEPFAGSCAVMMNTDYPAYLVADINADLINLYVQIKEHENEFLSLAAQVFAQNKTEERYFAIRAEFNNEPALSVLYRAVYFLYLNRHGYRGVCRYNLGGGFNVAFEKISKPYFPEKEVSAFAAKSHRATFVCAGFADTLALVRHGDVIYIDPPYDGTFSKYHTQGFGRSEHIKLAAAVQQLHSLGYPVVVSNSDTQFTREAYTGFEINSITTFRSIGVAAGTGKKAAEIVAVSR
ncbi:Dam family site-specific DNA-(adenine-N6)-methyltransferase [Erwinia pyrifoliae]|uniref:Site-specific DNA-methyltransferase (adenine-specific) n=1 Tax=Erwinia pyrifoliae TaxID=79967 RepID=A0ABY5XED2_ERWPY|nr:Dam family site-specific DNA-(adenine-N6)-methyltransferase [Erwinia pyrifoliae]MCT2387315.1 Dam family site-specific DNA-(adenine-N6)-methyltransferase [Erwinia pyrifoliae]MCU8587085.1 Dam family site-specific DNA-(adenine-N6)-methyltransferase [Erwinia pyrifoliae]UWS30948.1 Dam family site-specific DNA-(adenine-N6)-methyltransferase [Erwinia pyrifoliae]UWS35254.1 Dam family site-specific DNA-(adenine-N6)-methyltransferase [Erwinia pyrifoliae]